MCLPGSAENNAPQWEHIVRSEDIVSDESSRRRQYQLFSLWSVSQQTVIPATLGEPRADPKPLKINRNVPISVSRPRFLHWTGPSGLDFTGPGRRCFMRKLLCPHCAALSGSAAALPGCIPSVRSTARPGCSVLSLCHLSLVPPSCSSGELVPPPWLFTSPLTAALFRVAGCDRSPHFPKSTASP